MGSTVSILEDLIQRNIVSKIAELNVRPVIEKGKIVQDFGACPKVRVWVLLMMPNRSLHLKLK